MYNLCMMNSFYILIKNEKYRRLRKGKEDQEKGTRKENYGKIVVYFIALFVYFELTLFYCYVYSNKIFSR